MLNSKNRESIVDREIGSLRNIFNQIKNFFYSIFFYVRSFFRMRKIDQIKAIFSTTDALKERDNVLNSEIEENMKNKSSQ